MNEVLNSENDLTTEGIAKGFLGRVYAPTVIATEQERESASFGTLTTADEVKNVVVPENGLIAVSYLAIAKSSVSGAGRVAIFIGANQLKKLGATAPEVSEVSTFETAFSTVHAGNIGLVQTNAGTSFVTTGQTLGTAGGGNWCYVTVAAGTYNVSVQYKATSGKVVAKERSLRVGVVGGV